MITRTTIRDTLLIAIILLLAIIFAPELARSANPPADPGPTPYPSRVVARQAKQLVRLLFAGETIAGGGCSRIARSYDCYVDVYNPVDQAYESHGFFGCTYRRAITRHRYRMSVPETAWIYVAHRGVDRGGVRCQATVAYISPQKRHQRDPYRGTGAGR